MQRFRFAKRETSTAPRSLAVGPGDKGEDKSRSNNGLLMRLYCIELSQPISIRDHLAHVWLQHGPTGTRNGTTGRRQAWENSQGRPTVAMRHLLHSKRSQRTLHFTCSLEEGLAKGETKKRRTGGKVEIFEEGLEGLPERLGDNPLRMIIVGTNPSGHAW